MSITIANITYGYSGTTARVTGNTLSTLTSVTIPSTIQDLSLNTYTVRSIDNIVFLSNTFLASITLPNTLQTIGGQTFQGCTNLTNVTFVSTPIITSIGSAAFGGCTNLPNFTMPNSVTTIGFGNTFSGCTNLTSITYSNNLNNITDTMFRDCVNLRSFIMPNSVTSIGSQAFVRTSKLTYMTLSNNINSLASECFASTAIPSFILPNTLTNIGFNAFANNNNLNNILFLGNQPTSSTNLFLGCNNLPNVYYLSGRTWTLPTFQSKTLVPAYISNNYYYATSGIESTIIGNTITSFTNNLIPNTITDVSNNTYSVTSINGSAFLNNQYITSTTIPSNVTNIGNYAFAGCSLLSYVLFLGNQPSTTTGSTIFVDDPLLNVMNYYTYRTWTSNPFSPTTLTGIQYPCFKEGSKILCLVNNVEEYVPVEQIRSGDLVKTCLHGYKKVEMIGTREIHHPSLEERIKEQLYKCTKENYPELTEDLVITGCHSILVDDFTSNEEREKTTEVLGRICVTDDKYRLPACVDERTVVYEKEGNHNIYHLALEHEDYYMNYGVYANGLLVESCSRRYLKELSKMRLL